MSHASHSSASTVLAARQAQNLLTSGEPTLEKFCITVGKIEHLHIKLCSILNIQKALRNLGYYKSLNFSLLCIDQKWAKNSSGKDLIMP